jgi:tryptophan 2,3-dioxygenase
MTTDYDARPLPLTDPTLDVSSNTYWDYHGLDQVLGAKQPLTASKDEDLFICVHQICEVAFHQMITDLGRSLDATADAVAAADGLPPDLAEAEYFLGRVLPLYDVVNRTMPILSGLRAFAEFRTAIGPTSGFQSYQFRRLEIMSGVDRPYWRGGTADAEGVPHQAEQDLDRHWGQEIAGWFADYRTHSLAHWWRVAVDRADGAGAAAALPDWTGQLRR